MASLHSSDGFPLGDPEVLDSHQVESGDFLCVLLGWLGGAGETLDIYTPKLNIEPENDDFQNASPFPGVHCQVPC